MPKENRTERATPYRRKRLREEGNVAKSLEIATAGTILVGTIVIFFVGHLFFYKILKLFWNASSNPFIGASVILAQVKDDILPLILPFFILTVLVVVLTHIAQFGFIFTLKPIQPKLERLNPFEGFKRIFSLTTLFELLKNSLKVFLLMLVAYFFFRSELGKLIRIYSNDLTLSIKDFLIFTFKLVIFVGVVALFIALLDYAYKRWDYERKIRMSKEEVKEEYKQQEGNPMIKGAIRKRMRQLAKGRMLQEVPKASVVITNPTHIAIAMRYSPEEGDKAPVVLAKGKGQVAERIVEVATINQVPIVRREALARALYPAVEVGEEIPPKFYRAVAEIIAFVMARRRRLAV
ncbi:flagellar biosynthesis protein FlhB [Thermocrinis sp.]